MKMKNWYTTSLISVACSSFLFSLVNIEESDLNIFIIMTGIVIMLEIFPIRLPSGDHYAAGSIGYLFLLVYSGLSYAVLAIVIATLAYYVIKIRKDQIPIIRLFVTIGLYVISSIAAYLVWEIVNPFTIYIGLGMAAFVFELVNIVLIEGIQATVYRKTMFTHIRQQLKELTIPVIVSTIVLSRLMLIKSVSELVITMFYSLFFLLIVLFFSYVITNQMSLRKSTSSAFIQVLEGCITPTLAGHGNRVGVICDIILEDMKYPKKMRHDLVQIATIHDIGKALIPSYVFSKRGDLTLAEEREYKSHPEKAVEIVKTMFPHQPFSNWILFHHERWDGKGFPNGLKGEEIPLESRIIGMCNELDHILLRHDDPETILKLLNERSETKLDPNIVKNVQFHHIEMILEAISEREDLPQPPEENENPYSQNDSYSNIGESFFIPVMNGQIVSTNQLPRPFLQSLVNTALQQQEPVHETLSHEGQTLDIYAQSQADKEVTVFAHDLTPYLRYRKKLEQDILDSYSEVVETLSEGKMKLHSSISTLEEQLGDWMTEMPINNTSDVPKSRELTVRLLKQYPTVLHTMNVQVSVSEAVTNSLKHATGGKLSIHKRNQTLQFFISDKGSGIPLHEIPKTILVSGYSSKRSLGQGFKMIASFSDHVQIYTSSEGTSILIEYKQLEKDKEDSNQAS